MNKRLRNLAISAATGILIASVISSMLSSGRVTSTPTQALENSTGSTIAPDPSPVEQSSHSAIGASSSDSTDDGSSRREYAIAVAQLRGLPPDAAPQSRFDLWVAWDPPIASKPTVQRLIKGVVLERIIPAVTPDGPDAALVSVRVHDLSSLLFADRYGALSVALIPSDP